MAALLDIPPVTDFPMAPTEAPRDNDRPLTDDVAQRLREVEGDLVTPCINKAGHEWVEQSDTYAGRAWIAIVCNHCGDPAPEGIRDYEPLPVWWCGRRL